MSADGDTREPACVELTAAQVGGRAAYRLMVILRAPGCGYALRTGGCTNCGFSHLTTNGAPVPADHLVEQLDRALQRQASRAETIHRLDLFCSGSFFGDDEIPAAAREGLLRRAALLPALEVVLVESRPELIGREALQRATRALAGPRKIQLELAIGLESADDAIRLRRIRKGFTLREFEQAAALLAAEGVGLVAHVLLKPLGTGEAEALEDTLRTGRYLQQLAGRLALPTRVALEPTFVPEGTPLYDELKAGRFHPPSLWSVVTAARGLRELGLPVFVGLSHEGLPAAQVPAGCARCTPILLEALGRFNATQDTELLAGLSCPCQAKG